MNAFTFQRVPAAGSGRCRSRSRRCSDTSPRAREPVRRSRRSPQQPRAPGTTQSESTAREEKRSVRKGDQEMSTATTASATTAPTEFLRVKDETYAYRRIGGGFRRPSALSATFHRHVGQLGSRRDGSARRRAGSHSVRQRWNRTVNREGADHGSRNGSACLGIPRRLVRDELRRARILARRNGRAADGTRPALEHPSDDSGRHRAARR